jgi:hypothetical protein
MQRVNAGSHSPSAGRRTRACPGVRPPPFPCSHTRTVFARPHFRSNPFGIIQLLRSKMMQPNVPARCAETHTSPSLTTRNVRRLEVGYTVLVTRPEAAWPRGTRTLGEDRRRARAAWRRSRGRGRDASRRCALDGSTERSTTAPAPQNVGRRAARTEPLRWASPTSVGPASPDGIVAADAGQPCARCGHWL